MVNAWSYGQSFAESRWLYFVQNWTTRLQWSPDTWNHMLESLAGISRTCKSLGSTWNTHTTWYVNTRMEATYKQAIPGRLVCWLTNKKKFINTNYSHFHCNFNLHEEDMSINTGTEQSQTPLFGCSLYLSLAETDWEAFCQLHERWSWIRRKACPKWVIVACVASSVVSWSTIECLSCLVRQTLIAWE